MADEDTNAVTQRHSRIRGTIQRDGHDPRRRRAEPLERISHQHRLAHTIGALLGVDVRPQFAPPRDGEVRHSRAAVARFAERAGFRAATDLRAGLEATIADMRSLRLSLTESTRS